MQKRLLFKIGLTLFIGINYTIYSNSKKSFVAESCRFPDGEKCEAIHKNISRAGVLIVVPLHRNSTDIFENYGIIVGFDKNIKTWMLGQAGKCDHDDLNTAITASRELKEETGGYYKLNPAAISRLPYLSIADKQMFIHKVDDVQLPLKIKEAVKKAQLNAKLGQSYKEINDIEVVSLKNLLELAQKIDSGSVKQNKYFIKTTTGKEIKLEKFYMQVFAHPCDHARLEYAKKMFEMICA